MTTPVAPNAAPTGQPVSAPAPAANLFPGLANAPGGLMSMFAPVPGPFMTVPATPGMPASGAAPGNGTNNAGIQPTGAQGAQPTSTPGQDQSQSPLDPFKGLWDTPRDTAGNPIADTPSTPGIAFDPAKVGEAISKVNFASQVPPELLTKALSGDQAAFSEVLNTTNRSVFMMAASSFVKLMEQQLAKQAEYFQQTVIPNAVRKYSAHDALATENPQLMHPAVQPLIGALTAQFQKQYPTATTADVTKMAKDYLTAALGVVKPPEKPAAPGTPGAPGIVGTSGVNLPGSKTDDWEPFFTAAPNLT